MRKTLQFHRLNANRHRLVGSKGFALVIALGLMAFVLVLLLAFTAQIQVESHVSAQSKSVTSARQNALLGLNVALGDLQKYVGPDTRTTGSADLWDDPANTPVVTLPTSSQKYRHWLGVWDSSLSRAIDDPSSTDGSMIYNSTMASADAARRKPDPLKWLVSGIAADGSDADPEKALDASVAIVDGGSVADSNQDGVEVGLMSIGDDAEGRYAYWVSDESLKARYGIVEPEALINSGNSDEAEARILANRSSGVGVVYTDNLEATVFEDLGYDTNSSNGREELRLVSDLLIKPVDGDYVIPFKHRYHDISFFSEGLLTNPVEGGLKKDLTAYLQTGVGLNSDDLIIDGSRYPDIHLNGENLPRWGKVRDWANLPSTLVPKVGDDEVANVSPVITFAGFDVGVSLDVDQLYVHLFPEIAIWNPYNTPLDSVDGYTVTFRIGGGSSRVRLKDVHDVPSSGDPQQDYLPDSWAAGGNTESGIEIQVGEMLAQAMGIAGPSYPDWTQRIFLRFHLDDGAGVSLAPGEVAVYTLNSMEVLSGNPMEMIRGRVEPFENNPSIRILAETLIPEPRDQLDFIFTEVSFDWADVRLFPGLETSDPAPTESLQRLYYSSWGGSSGDVSGSLDPSAGNAGVALRNYPGRMSLRPHSFHAASVWPTMEPYSSLRGMSQYNYRSQFIPKIPSGGTAYNSSDIPSSAQTFTKEAGPMIFAGGEFDFPLSPSTAENAYAPWAMFGAQSTSASVDVSRQSSQTPIFWLPDGAEQLLSIGNLQHAPMSAHIWQPSYAVGNAYADPLITRNHYSGLFDSAGYYYQEPATSTDSHGESVPENAHLDISFLMNDAIWDDYFLSGFSAVSNRLELTSDQLSGVQALPNSRLQLQLGQGDVYGSGETSTALGQFNTGASHLTLTGAFNVNSTSVEAWKALIASGLGLPINGTDPTSGTVTVARMPNPGGGAGGFLDANGEALPLAEAPGAYNDARSLDLDEVQILAEKIVEEVKLRGPFLGLSDFVNRRMIQASDDPENTGLRGALQAAIDKASAESAGLNERFIDSGNTQTFFTATDIRPAHVIPEHALAGESEYTTSAGVPGFITQGDLLSALGSNLTSRGDTFVIRAYGQTQDKVTGNAEAEAWCEAVVQRQIDYINDTDEPWDTPVAGTVNANFGRQFRIVSFRWLDRDEI